MRSVANVATYAVLGVTILLNLSGCVSLSGTHNQTAAETELTVQVDPWEHYNRAMFRFNSNVDRAVLKPVAAGYVRVIPPLVRRGVNNFFHNLREPTSIINSLLQGKVKQGAIGTGRFLTNTTIGILGVFDLAMRFGLKRHQEDFGQTLAVWGVPQGPYLVLPLLGPSTVRDGAGLIPFYAYTDLRNDLGDTEARIALTALDVIDTRTTLLSTDRLLELQLDPYVFLREGYLQQRNNLIDDGRALEEDFLDEDFDELD